ncbi:MAG: HEAT repeat domain-containing protein, partial [Planctomycetota bacterium]
MNAFHFVLIGSFLLSSIGIVPRSHAQDELVELVTGLLADPDKELRALAFNQIRKEAKGEATTRKFAEMLPQLPTETQIGLLSALADRGDSAAAPSVRNLLAASPEETVRVAVIEALGALGGREDLDILLQSMSTGSQPTRDAARAALIRLPADASSAMVAELKESPVATRVALLEILTVRRAREAVPAMLETARDDDGTVREAATNA